MNIRTNDFHECSRSRQCEHTMVNQSFAAYVCCEYSRQCEVGLTLVNIKVVFNLLYTPEVVGWHVCTYTPSNTHVHTQMPNKARTTKLVCHVFATERSKITGLKSV